MLQQGSDSFLPDAVLHHLDHAHVLVGCVCLGPGRHAAGLQSVAAADDGLEVRDILALRAGFLFAGGELLQGLGDEGAGGGAEAVVVEVEVAEGHVLAEERAERLDGVEAEGVVVQVDRVQLLALEEGSEEGVERRGDLGQQAAGEDVGEVGVLEVGLCGEDLGEALAGGHSEGVAFKDHFLDVVVEQGLDVRDEVFGGVELESAAAQGEDFGVGHGCGCVFCVLWWWVEGIR